VRDYGAIGDGASRLSGGVEADWLGIQEALNEAARAGGGIVELGRGVYVIDRPLVIPYTETWGRAGITLRGVQGGYTSTIRKITNTPGVGGRETSSGRLDDYGIDAILMVDHPNGTINRHVAIEALTLASAAPEPVAVGIYAPRMSYALLADVRVNGCWMAYLGYQLALSRVERMYAEGPGPSVGAGFVLADDGSHANSSTSLTMDTVYMQRFREGFRFTRLFYSSLNALAMDHCGAVGAAGTAYKIENSQGVTLSGIGAEDVRGVTLLLNDSWVAIQGFFGYALRGYSADYGTLQVEDGHVVLSACYWPPLLESNGQYDAIYSDTPEVIDQACALPSGGAGVKGARE